MLVYRIDINSWTAGFRYPNLISGVQPTMDVPPLSTVLGIINAAAGQYIKHKDLEIGYYFEYEGKAFDLETIYMISTNSKGLPSNNAKSNVIQREFLADTTLSIYLKDEKLVEFLRNPYYDILLGRSGDLARVTVSKTPLNLEEVTNATKLKGQIVPLMGNFLPGKIQALPQYFSNDFPRKTLGAIPYSIIKYSVSDFNSKITAYRDLTKGKDGVDIFFHHLSFDYE